MVFDLVVVAVEVYQTLLQCLDDFCNIFLTDVTVRYVQGLEMVLLADLLQLCGRSCFKPVIINNQGLEFRACLEALEKRCHSLVLDAVLRHTNLVQRLL